jgi:hypothetical protein
MGASIRVVAAVALAGVGMGWAWWSFYRTSPVGPPRATHIEVSDAVTRAFSGLVLDAAPTDETAAAEIERAVGAARVRAGELIDGGQLDPSRLEDLLTLFGQCLRNTVTGDFDSHLEMMRHRGDSSDVTARDRERKDWLTQANLTRNARFSVGRLEVRQLFDRGKRRSATPAEEGFSGLESRPTTARIPIAQDAVVGHLDVVEVRLPMATPVVGSTLRRPVLVGYQFAWNDARHQWSPWAICIYHDPNEVHYGIYF